MNLHDFPWPCTQLEELGESEVEPPVTLSYYVEPNPCERGWLRRRRPREGGLGPWPRAQTTGSAAASATCDRSVRIIGEEPLWH
ncbi:MAG: hypothetical protein K1X42_14140 [Opitutaceae bacterium]|nr:hypothetical protein [Opitutaceae bacterium]